jgi:hypothetical protein
LVGRSDSRLSRVEDQDLFRRTGQEVEPAPGADDPVVERPQACVTLGIGLDQVHEQFVRARQDSPGLESFDLVPVGEGLHQGETGFDGLVRGALMFPPRQELVDLAPRGALTQRRTRQAEPADHHAQQPRHAAQDLTH